jgi:PadR family transcriptional regulator PadR
MKTISKREEQILIAIWKLKESAYLLAIKNHLSEIMEADWSVGAIHKPLMKLEKEGLVESYLGEATARRGGRSKKIYRVSKLGLSTLKALKEEHDALWAKFPFMKKA